MLNSYYFDRTPLVSSRATSADLNKAIIEDTDTFVRFCAQEFALENYIALLCICAFNKLPNLQRLQTFYVAFLKKESPLQINVKDIKLVSVVRLVTVGPTYKRNSRGIDVAEAPLQTDLNSLIDPIIVTLTDAYLRYKSLPNLQGSRIDRLLHIPTKTGKVLAQQKPISNQNLLKGLNILASGGWPVRYMGLSKIVIGF